MRTDLVAAVLLLAVLAAGDAVFSLSDYVRNSGRRPLETLQYDISPQFIEGVSTRGRLVSNAQGLRGEIFSAETMNVLLVGGSTTYCQLLDERETLTARVGRYLRSDYLLSSARAATSSRGGQMVRVSTRNVRWLSESDATRPDVVVAMVGLNNMIDFYLHAPWPDGMEAGDADAWIPQDSPFSPANQASTHRLYNDPNSRGEWVVELRQKYAAHPKLSVLDARLTALIERWEGRYENELRELLDTTRSLNSRLVLATQPINFIEGVPESVEDWNLYINPGPGEGFVPSPELMAEMLGRFNSVTRAFARDNGVPFVDLAEQLTGCTECFYDQWHFTAQGADRAGALLANTVAAANAAGDPSGDPS